MDFRLLGPLEVRDGGRSVPISGPKQRALLALLLLEPDRVVPTARILERLWDERPDSGPKAVQMCVSGLRKALPRDVLLTASPGYRLRVEPDAVDIHRFEQLVAGARGKLAEQPARAAELLREALALWRGPALAEFASERFAVAEAVRLEALREDAVEQRIEAELALGRHVELVPELESLVAAHPLREGLRGQLMRALYRSGRQADALSVYHDTRETLVEELGIDPGPELQRLQQAILRQDPELDAPAPAPPRTSPARALAVLEERKLVTTLFADLADSTALGERLDPERLRIVLADYFEAMSSVVARWGGTVEKFIGDAVVAVFGIPAMREDDAERALGAALEMRDRLDDLNGSLLERYGIRLTLRIGVNTGDVIAGGPTGQFMVTGDAVNAAARLEQAAEPGEILVGERTHRATGHAFELVERGALALKGKSGTVPAWRLVAARAAAAPRRGPFVGPLVGRERELLLLETFFTGVVDDEHPQLVALVGPAGIGKSRLVEELLRRTPGRIYRGRCLSYGEGITYWALREVLWGAAGIALDDPAPAAAAKVRSFVAELPGLSDAERERVSFALGVTAGLAVAETSIAEVSPESVREELELTWPLFVSAVAELGPLVLVIEDLHWGEPQLLEMLDRLLVRAVGPILIIATSRPDGDELPSLRSHHPGAHQISLEPLRATHARELLDELLPDGEAVRETILEAGEGNPFFLEELTRHVVETGGGGAAVELPDTIRTLLAARIDALPAAQKSVVHDAAVLGRVFWPNALEAMRGREVRAALSELEQRGLVLQRPFSQLTGEPEFTFRHGLVREVAYQAIPRARRAPAHAAAAAWIAELAGDRRDEFIELIAHHAGAAADPENAALAWPDDPVLREDLRRKAVAALVAAGDAARARFALPQALRFADRALALADGDDERMAAVELKADIAHTGVRVQEAWDLYGEALGLAERLGDRAAGARLAASATLLWTRYFGAFPDTDWHEPAEEFVNTWLERLGESNETFEVGALLAGRASFASTIVLRSPADSLADAERAVAVAESIGSPKLLSYAVDVMTMIMAADGLCDSARAGRLAAEARTRVDDRWTAHEMLINAAQLHAAAGELGTAAELAAEAAREAATLSSHQRIHAAAANTYALVPLGRLAELRSATEAVPALVEEEQRTACYHGLVALAGQLLAVHEAGDGDAVARLADLIDGVTSAGPDPLGERLRAIELMLRVRGPEESARRLREHREPLQRTASIRYLRVALQVAALGGDRATVEELAPRARRLASESCAPALAAIADWAAALVSEDWGRAEEAALRLADAGEAYLSARLLADLVPLLPPAERPRPGGEALRRLEVMGAATSAAQVQGALVPGR